MVLPPSFAVNTLVRFFSFELQKLFARQRQRWMPTDNLISQAVGDMMVNQNGCCCPCTERYPTQLHVTKVALPRFIDF